MQVTVGQDQLQIVRLQSIDMEPVKDPSGWDYLYTAITIDFWFEWHPHATASNSKNPQGGPPPWDSVGDSLAQLRERLGRDRQPFILKIGATVVWESPESDGAGGRLACDVGGGPHYKLLSLFGLEGDYGAMGRLRATIYKNRNLDLLLSNRWNCRSVTNTAGMTTRVIDGWAVMRPDAINPKKDGHWINVDVFRNWLFCPCPSGFRRENVDVQITELGDKAHYVVTDVEDPNPMGANGGFIHAAYFEGKATAGTASPIKSWKQAAGAVGHFFSNPIEATLQSVIADTLSRCTVRVVGHKGVPKYNLFILALQIALDRAAVNNAVPEIVGVFATQGLGRAEEKGRWVEVEVMFYSDLTVLVGQALDYAKVGKQMNYSNDVKLRNADGAVQGNTFPGDSPQALPAGAAYQNFNMPRGVNDNDQTGSRGTYVGALMVAALQSPLDTKVFSQPVLAPPAEVVALSADKII